LRLSVKPANLMWTVLIWTVLIGMVLWTNSGTASATQAIALRPGDTLAQLEAASLTAAVLNGPMIFGRPRQADDISPRAIMPLILTLATHRYADRGLLTLDEPLSQHVPHLVDDPPFSVTILIRHLLTESAGYAAPPFLWDWPGYKAVGTDTDAGTAHLNRYRAPLQRYMLPVRTAGQIAQRDLVGWAVLIRVLEAASGLPLPVIIQSEILEPLGLTADDVQLGAAGSPTARAFAPLLTSQISPDAEARLIRLLFRNRSNSGGTYLSRERYILLTETVNLQPHPLMNGRTAGLERRLIGSRWALSLAGGCHLIFPKADIAVILTPETRSRPNIHPCTGQDRLSRLVDRDFPSTDRSTALALATARLRPPETLLGPYAHEDRAAAHMRARIDQILSTVKIGHRKGGDLRIDWPDGTPTSLLDPIAPYAFAVRGDMNDGTVPAHGQTAVFSRYRIGGYAEIDGDFYRFTGVIGDPDMVLWPGIAALIILLTAAIHWREDCAPEWRRMARCGAASVVLITAGLVAEYTLWDWARYEIDQAVLVTIWRVGLNIGVALSLSVVLYCLSISKRGLLPVGAKALWTPLHLAVLAASGCVVFLCLIALGLAGNF